MKWKYLLALMLLLPGCAFKQRCVTYKIVVAIGTEGRVVYEDGTYGYVRGGAAPGENVCAEWNTTYWIWEKP